MAYDEKLAERVRKVLATRTGVTEKIMFGGLAFLLSGRMCCGVLNEDLVVRTGPERHAAALARPHTRPMDFTGRPLTGFVYVGLRGVKTDAALATWVREAVKYALSLPERRVGQKRRASRRRANA